MPVRTAGVSVVIEHLEAEWETSVETSNFGVPIHEIFEVVANLLFHFLWRQLGCHRKAEVIRTNMTSDFYDHDGARRQTHERYR